MAKARAFKAAKQYAWAAMKEAGTGQATSATLRFSFHPKPKGRKPDMDNCIASVKAYIDGIALALGCDDGKFKLHFPAELSDPRIDGRVSVEIDLG
jgi:crossover junction endodeoxyribonuclease RusA